MEFFSSAREEQSTTITEVAVSKLFGRYDYALEFDPRLAILYGDNGTGKTTILRMIHNLLSPGPGRGHKTAVASIPFHEFRINFSNGATIHARREGASVGTFELRLYLPDGSNRRAPFITNEDAVIPRNGPHSDRQDDLMRDVSRAIALRSYYLSDDRNLDSDFIDEEQHSREFRRRMLRYAREEDVIREIEKPTRYPQVSSAIFRAANWARQQALQGASEGSVSANTIY
ncbi:AAA family ATPase, partial [Streptomyces malaysiensis]|uniref:AAA family ATPase n=1 Tax=Streptomyces malaysiensis TaxID=92644 RepID=UPI0015E121EC